MQPIKKKKKPAPRQGARVNYEKIPGFDDRGLVLRTVPVSESTHLYAAETFDGKVDLHSTL